MWCTDQANTATARTTARITAGTRTSVSGRSTEDVEWGEAAQFDQHFR
jgi:hypothetical protein